MSITFFSPGSQVRNIMYGLMKILVPFWCNCTYKFKVHGTNNIPKGGPAIIAPKHQYWTDIPLIGFAFYNIQLNYVAKRELFNIPLISHFLIALGGIPLDRGAPIKSLDSFRHLTTLLKQKQYVVIFPEGTYYRGFVGKGKSRLIKMILKFQETEKRHQAIPFIPVGVIYKKNGFRKTVAVNIGKPFFAEKESEAQSLTNSLMEQISHLSNMPLQNTSRKQKSSLNECS
ncbi:MAG: lysophospholipid acyltransferase family protein [Thermodesulfobacteriota bacterium]|nr:lysophospholipid acyltransferase family protein [Thermodesulfobacteriota bacterium]